MDFNQEYEKFKNMVEERLDGCFITQAPQKTLMEAMRYSLLAGGKRLRPILTLKFCEAAGGNAKNAMDYALGAEMMHTYSLIHDDLPCMDGDDLRRGKPTNHVVYGECTAVLAGDALQAAAFASVFSAPNRAEQNVAAGAELAAAAGAYGMCGGQYMDMLGETEQFDAARVEYLQRLKTGALLRAAAVMGVIAAGDSARVGAMHAASDYAEALGIAFQVRDDILDCTSTTEELGKPVGSDSGKGKSTFVSLLGIDACQRLVREQTERAKKALEGHFENPEFLCRLADKMAGRAY